MQDSLKQTEALKLLCRQWDNAIEGNDAAEIGKFMADDWVIVGTEGGISSKSHFLGFIKSGDLFHNRMDFEDLRVNVYDNTGIVISKGTSIGTYKRIPFSYYEWSTSVFIKKEDRWLCVLTMLTPVEKQPL
jgi:ketosteroid isomerase-like protein